MRVITILMYLQLPKKTKATKYVTRFNRILKKWKDHYEQYESNKLGIPWIEDFHMDKYHRWSRLRDVSRCYWVEVEIR
jgi:hypothetical protein